MVDLEREREIERGEYVVLMRGVHLRMNSNLPERIWRVQYDARNE